MLRRLPSQVACTAVLLASALAPAPARAQLPSPFTDRAPLQAPSLIVSLAASPVGLDDWRRSEGPALVGSVQGRLNQFLVLEGEVTRWTAVDDIRYLQAASPGTPIVTAASYRDREVWTVGTNLLFRGGNSRVTAFAGGGLGVRLVREDSSSTSACLPVAAGPPICTGEPISHSSRRTETGLSPQFLVGGEFWMTRRLAAYGGARFAFGADEARSTAGFAPLAGLRVALRTTDVVPERPRVPEPARAAGKDVRVTLNDGTTRRGKLVAMTGSVVDVDGTTMALADVQKIEKVGHATRKAVAIGIVAFPVTVLVLGPAADMGTDMAMAIAAAGLGAGIGVGAVIDAVRKPGNVIYRASGTSASFAVTPILTPARKGVAVAARW